MYATNFLEALVLNLAKGISITAPKTMYLALFLNDPTDAGGGTEVSYSGYERQQITFSAPAPVSAGMQIQNIDTIAFTKSAQDVGTVTHVGVFDSISGGNMYVYSDLVDPLQIQANIAPIVRAGSAKWTMSGKISNAYKTKILNVMRGTSCNGFDPYLALCNGSPEEGGAEFAGNAYQRTPITFSSPAEQASGATMISNSESLESPTATGTWGSLTHVAVYDNVSNGEPFVIDKANPAVTITKDKAVIYEIGALKIGLN